MKHHFSSLAALLLAAAPLTAQTWDPKANGQTMLTPTCSGPGAPFNFPNNSFWSQQEVVGTYQCGNPPTTFSYTAQPSNWSSPQFPNGPGATVTINGPRDCISDVDVLVNSLTIGPNGGLVMTNQGRITGQRLIVQRDTQIGYSAIRGGFKADLFVTAQLAKTNGTGALTFAPEVGVNIDHAAINITSGRIVLPGRGLIDGANIVLGDNTLLDLTGGGVDLSLGGAITGTGTGTVLLQNGVIYTSPFNAGGSVRTPLTLNFPGAMFQWTGGQLGTGTSGSAPFSNIGTINVTGPATKALLQQLANSGTINFSGGALFLDQGTITDNQAGGTLDFRGDYALRQGQQRGGAYPIIINRGLLVKSAGSGDLKMDEFVGFSNRGGTVRADAGTIRFGPAFNRDGGTFIAAAGALIDLTGGFSTGGNLAGFSGTYTGSGAGTVSIAGGVFNTGGQDDAGNFLPGATLNFPGNLFQWTGGLIQSGRATTLINSGVMNLSGADTKSMYQVMLTNNGTMNLRGTGEFYSDRTIITNSAGALIDIQSDLTITSFAGNNPTGITNLGTFRKSAGSGTTAVNADNGFGNSGRVEALSGRLAFKYFTQSGGVLQLANGGSVSVTGGQNIQFSGGAITGTGTIAGNVVNSGALTVGSADNAASAISIAGNFTNNSNATLTANIGGIGAGAFGMLTVSGAASLNGALTLNLVNGFKLRAGDTFRVISAASATGAFSAVNFPAGVTGTVAASGGNVTVTITGAPPAASLINISTRARIETGDNVLIGGFVIAGSVPKRVVIRALGPSLAASVPNVLSNPQITIFNGQNQPIASNDNWRSSQQAEILATNRQPTDDREAAVILTLNPGGYTAIVSGVGGEMGVGLIEVYDLDPAGRETARPINVSTRARVLTGDNVLIGGFVVGGTRPRKVIIRAIAPSLAAVGVQGTLPDPALTIFNGQNQPVASNDDWRSSPAAAEITALNRQPTDDRESALILTLDPGGYTAIVSGKGGQTGVALVEVYDLE